MAETNSDKQAASEEYADPLDIFDVIWIKLDNFSNPDRPVVAANNDLVRPSVH